jgi:hypothetical protein
MIKELRSLGLNIDFKKDTKKEDVVNEKLMIQKDTKKEDVVNEKLMIQNE